MTCFDRETAGSCLIITRALNVIVIDASVRVFLRVCACVSTQGVACASHWLVWPSVASTWGVSYVQGRAVIDPVTRSRGLYGHSSTSACQLTHG